MTLLGNALLARRCESHRYRVLPFPGGRGTGEVIEVYPGATLEKMQALLMCAPRYPQKVWKSGRRCSLPLTFKNPGCQARERGRNAAMV